MARYAIIEDGVVVNVAEATNEFAATKGWILVDQESVGWTYTNGVFSPPTPTPTLELVASTKEQLMAELAALTVKIQALE